MLWIPLATSARAQGPGEETETPVEETVPVEEGEETAPVGEETAPVGEETARWAKKGQPTCPRRTLTGQ